MYISRSRSTNNMLFILSYLQTNRQKTYLNNNGYSFKYLFSIDDGFYLQISLV